MSNDAVYQPDVLAMLRDYQMHEPECPMRIVQKWQAGSGAFIVPQPCTCWLAYPPVDEDAPAPKPEIDPDFGGGSLRVQS